MIDRSRLRWNGWGWADYVDPIASRDEVWSWLACEMGMPSLLATPARPLEDITLPPSRLTASQRHVLHIILGADQVREDKFERAFHARGRSYHDLLRLRAGDLSDAPDAVVYPQSGNDVLKLLAFASETSTAVVPYGGGTSVVGGVTPTRGQFKSVLSVDLSAMNRIESIDKESLTARVEAGIDGPTLERHLEGNGVTLGHYPQSFEFSTLGGWIAHRGAGQQSNRYGRAEDWLVAAELATPRGILRDAEFPASAAGPRLTDLIEGSEGVFGIVTRATVRLHRIPETTETSAYLFRDFASGAQAIREAAQSEIPVAMLRLSDGEETGFHRAFSQIGAYRGFKDRITQQLLRARRFGDGSCVLIAQFEGARDLVFFSRQRLNRIAKRIGTIALGEGPGKRWRANRFHGPYLRDPMLDRGLGVDTLETATSWSRVQPLYDAVRKALQDSIAASTPRPGAKGVVMCHISHSYPDGASLYFTYIYPRTLNGDIEQWRGIKQAATHAIAVNGGTISHHHGVGQDHLPWMMQEKGMLGVDVLRAVKRTLDPKGILNPEKLIPA
ncbi:MAG TPA: FAD-binding oxidoreductase [Rhizomicrobium sp.]|jgi:alkyldihydroxyacetonephosphate synthase|nr:FAD-binding oxidoreductase [Rhizomicrobium sp.]